MPCINEVEFRKRLRGDIWGCFVFFGEEDYLKSYCVRAAREKLCPDEGLACFNDISIDFLDFSVDALSDALAAPPMMCDCKLVVVKSFDFGGLKPSEVEALIALMGQYREDPSNLLILSVIPDGLDAGYLPKKPSVLLKKLMEVCTPVQFEVSTPAKLYAWAARHFQHEGIEAPDDAVRDLVDYCGRSMYTLSSEIEKLCAYLHSTGGGRVTRENIRFVCVPEEQCDAFALSNAAISGDRAAALSALAVLKFRQVKPEYVLFDISQSYCAMYQTKLLMGAGLGQNDIASALRIHSYKAGLYMKAVARQSEQALARAVFLCRDTELAMKTFAKRNYEQIEKLVCLL